MRLSQIALQNFRCFTNETIDISGYTALIGLNNVGKSTVLKAIDLFFGTSQRSSPITLDDFQDTSRELKISLSFDQLSPDAQAEFDHYYRHQRLEFFIEGHADQGSVQTSIHGRRLGIRDFGAFHAAGSAPEKKSIYGDLRGKYALPDIPSRSAVDVFRAALNEYEAQHEDECELIPSQDL